MCLFPGLGAGQRRHPRDGDGAGELPAAGDAGTPASQETQTPEAPEEIQEEAPLELEEAEQQTPQLSAPTEEAPLNLNTATQAELELLPGIGPVLAQAILDYRDSFGGFSAKEQLKEVSGIGEKRYAAVEALITVEVEDEGTGGR